MSDPKPSRHPKPPAKVFLIDKSTGVSSFAALGALKRSIGTRKVGHAGTLDPFASGLLAAFSGKLTKAAYLLGDQPKEYRAVFRFGAETDTLDIEGSITAHADLPAPERIEEQLGGFLGEIQQVPPDFSAVKIDGKRAYAEARKGRTVSLAPRGVTIHSLHIISSLPPDITLDITCSKGTYIRALARDLGRAAGSLAYCRELKRTAVGPFRVNEAKASEHLTEDDGIDTPELCRRLGIPVISADDSASGALRAGRPLQSIANLPRSEAADILIIDPAGIPAALLHGDSGRLEYRVVFD